MRMVHQMTPGADGKEKSKSAVKQVAEKVKQAATKKAAKKATGK